MTDDARWSLMGEAVIGVSRRPLRLAALPLGIHPLPGPAVILAESFIDSPVGPYLSIAVGEPARVGVHAGYFFGIGAVNNADARKAGRQYWGYEYQVAALRWISDDGVRGIVWEDREIEIRAYFRPTPLPVVVPVRTVARRSDGPVVVPTRIRALARRAVVNLECNSSERLAIINGPHRGVVLSGMSLKRSGARRPTGLFSMFGVPIVAPEPRSAAAPVSD